MLTHANSCISQFHVDWLLGAGHSAAVSSGFCLHGVSTGRGGRYLINNYTNFYLIKIVRSYARKIPGTTRTCNTWARLGLRSQGPSPQRSGVPAQAGVLIEGNRRKLTKEKLGRELFLMENKPE